jgi:hypothetical protein
MTALYNRGEGTKSKLLVSLFLTAVLTAGSTGCAQKNNCWDRDPVNGRCSDGNSGGGGYYGGSGTAAGKGAISGSPDAGSSGISSGAHGGIGSSGSSGG